MSRNRDAGETQRKKTRCRSSDTWRDLASVLIMRPLTRDILRNRYLAADAMPRLVFGQRGFLGRHFPISYLAPTNQNSLLGRLGILSNVGQAGSPPTCSRQNSMCWRMIEPHRRTAGRKTSETVAAIHEPNTVRYRYPLRSAASPSLYRNDLMNVPEKKHWPLIPAPHFGHPSIV